MIVRHAERCAVCLRKLRSADAREVGHGLDARDNCARLLVPSAPPDWASARKALDGSIPLRGLAGWLRSARRVIAALMLHVALAGDGHLSAVARAVEALGCARLAERLRRRVRIVAAKPLTREEIRRAYRREVAPHHPDRGGDVGAFRRVTADYALRLTGAL